MELIDVMRARRSIRKYQNKPVEREKLNMIMEAGAFAPNPGGRQGAKIVMLTDAKLIDMIGIINASCENRNWSSGVSAEQPSIIDDLSIKSGFYGCPALAIVFVPSKTRTMVNAIGSAFVCAENMALEAFDLGLGSCVVGRAEATFSNPELSGYANKWGVGEDYSPVVFLCLGYTDGKYPDIKPRYVGRLIYVE